MYITNLVIKATETADFNKDTALIDSRRDYVPHAIYVPKFILSKPDQRTMYYKNMVFVNITQNGLVHYV